MSQQPRILVLEDHLPMRVVIVALLRQAGYEVDATANPYEALELLVAAESSPHPLTAGRSYDLVLVDHDLNSPGLHLVDADAHGTPTGWDPPLTGADFIREVQRLADPGTRAIPGMDGLAWAPPCIGISAADFNNERMLQAGAVAGLVKGRFERDLLPLVERVLTDHGYELPTPDEQTE